MRSKHAYDNKSVSNRPNGLTGVRADTLGGLTHLRHLASVEEILHHEQIELLLRVVLRVLVADTVNSQNLRQCRGPLRTGSGKEGRETDCCSNTKYISSKWQF